MDTGKAEKSCRHLKYSTEEVATKTHNKKLFFFAVHSVKFQESPIAYRPGYSTASWWKEWKITAHNTSFHSRI